MKKTHNRRHEATVFVVNQVTDMFFNQAHRCHGTCGKHVGENVERILGKSRVCNALVTKRDAPWIDQTAKDASKGILSAVIILRTGMRQRS